MAGYLHPDPAVEKWVRMRESTAQHFRWNARNARIVGALGLVVPAAIMYLAVKYDRKFDWTAKGPSPKAAPVEEEDA